MYGKKVTKFVKIYLNIFVTYMIIRRIKLHSIVIKFNNVIKLHSIVTYISARPIRAH